MKKILLAILLFPLLIVAQTPQLNFVHKNGEIIGRWKVMDLPTTLFGPGTPQGQLLIYYPTGKDSAHVGLGIWQPGKGETSSLDLTQMYTSASGGSLPAMIQNGLTPYSVLPNKDTIWHALVCIHNNFQSSYRAYLSSIIPYIMDKIGLKFNPNYTWGSGLSEGGAGTWAISCIDSLLSKRVHVIVPLATGGYDNFLSVPDYVANLKAAIAHKMYFLPYVGTQDPSYNAGGFLATDAFMKANASAGQYMPRVIPNGTHSSNVWDVPFKSRGFWDSLGMFMYVPTAPPTPPVNPLHARIWVDSLTIHYPNVSVHLVDSSAGKHNYTSWGATAYPTGFPGLFWGGITFGDMLLTNLMEGSYKVRLVIGDDQDNTDTAVVNIRVYGPPACPAPIICPAPRKVVSIQVPLFGVMVPIPVDAAKISYDDGNP